MQNKVRQFTCRRAAVFSDIHSNYHAFKACFEDARIHGADCFIFLGDYISDLADPVKTLDLVYEIQSAYPTVCLRGNRERYMLEHRTGISTFTRGSKTGSLLFTFDQLRPQDFDFIEALPIYDMIEVNGVLFEISHAARDDDRYYFDSSDGRIGDIFAQMEAAYLLTGHSHKQYTQTQQGKTIINPGSVGVPMGAHGLAQYALLDICDQAASCIPRAVPYDIGTVIHRQFENGLVNYAQYWAVSILYDVLIGEEYTLRLLERVSQLGDVHDEANWHNAAMEMGMKFTEREIMSHMKPTETAYFAGGCFWCITPTFKETPGVLDVVSGYSGGEEMNPTYADVKKQKTRHRETIRIDYAPEQVSFSELFDIFLCGVDPFDPDGQFIDRGHSYTLAVYYCSEDQRHIAERGIRALEAKSGRQVYISVEPFKRFYRAEEEHQDFYLKHPEEFEQELIESGRKKADSG